MKKLVALLLCLALSLGTVAALADTTLTLGIWPTDTDTRGLEVNENVFLPAYQALYPDVTVVKQNLEYSVDTFIPLAESGKLPTIFTTWFTEPGKLIRAGFVADITDAMIEKGWLEKLSPSVRELAMHEGRVYGIPNNAYALGMMINAELFEEAGLVDDDGLPLYPKTWDELIERAKIIKDETGSAGLVLLAMDNAAGWHFTTIAWSYGATLEVLGEDGKWTANLNSPEAVAALQMVKDMKWEHDILTGDPTNESWSTGFQQLGTGMAAMYIAADDAVAQPTANYGLPTDKLMMCGMPAGPAGAFELIGGNMFMFSADATHDEIIAALNWLEINGRAPILTETTREGLAADAKNNAEKGVPVIRSLSGWVDEEYNAARLEVIDEYANVDPRMFEPYFEATALPGALRGEEPVQTQDLYSELTKALQEVLTNKDADVQAVLDIANANFQALLDESVNK